MSSDDEWQTYVKDSRTICKYGAKCYQKNVEHHKTYKHPPKNMKAIKNTRDKRKFSPFTRKNKEKTVNNQTPNTSTVQIQDTDENISGPIETLSHNSNDVNIKMKIPDNIKYYSINPNHELFKELFLVHMPNDFYKFYECFDGYEIVRLLSTVNLELIGPYDLLLGKLPIVDDKELYLVHWRFYFDPPEFQAVIKKKGNSQFHIGYYRDNPDDKPQFLASNDSEKDCRITPIASNIFAAVYFYLENEKKTSPFVAMACQKVMDKLKKTALENNICIEKYSVQDRQAHCITKTLHGAGIVVPYNKKTQLGYRHLTESDANLKKIFIKLENAANQIEKNKVLSELQPVITYANIAVDECDFGTGLEAGIDLFCSGLKELEPSALSCLISAYNLLNRGDFSNIIMVCFY
ncbi:unnamed protein product [Diatraea saccharalis]|uniref:PBZ-type domain-containing protein n=1 Tax=Diatraea saccharalis TaxID=40085 RepID=A0A9P0C6R2_9NEOP|nr:unnamed protein product [Diatraea saccharalis]